MDNCSASGKKTCNFFGPFLAIVGAALVILSCGAHFYALDKYLDYRIKKARELREDNPTFKVWRSHNGQFIVYFFNITNPEDILNGSTPILQEVGPYVYDFVKEKVNLQSIDEDLWKFNRKYTSVFNASASHGSETDIIVTLDYPRVGVINLLQDWFPYSTLTGTDKLIANPLFQNKTSPFMIATAIDLLFNGVKLSCKNGADMVSALCRYATARAVRNIWQSTDEDRSFKFAFMRYGNMTDNTWYTVRKGKNDTKQAALITAIDDEKTLSIWGIKYGQNCNNFTSNDDLFFPIKETDKTLQYYVSQACKNFLVDLIENNLKYRDIQNINRFSLTSNAFASPDVNPDNKCTCITTLRGLKCAPYGMLQVSPCVILPALMSQPRFLDVTEEVWSKLQIKKIFKGNDEDLRTYLDVEPITGIPVRGSINYQFNMELKRIPAFPELAKIEPAIYPALWVKEITEIPNETYESLKKELDAIHYVRILIYGTCAVGVLFLLIACILIQRNGCGSRRNVEVDLVTNHKI